MLETTHHKKASTKEVEALLTLYYQGKFSLVLKKEKQFNSLYSDSVEVLNIFGSANIALQKYQKAIINFNKAIRINPYIPDIYYNLALAYHHINNLDNAIESYQKAIILKPDYAEAFCNMGMGLNKKGDMGGAIKNFYKALEINPRHAGAYINLGNIYSEQLDFLPAIKH